MDTRIGLHANNGLGKISNHAVFSITHINLIKDNYKLNETIDLKAFLCNKI